MRQNSLISLVNVIKGAVSGVKLVRLIKGQKS